MAPGELHGDAGVRFLSAAPEALPERAVGISFDDGYLDNLTVAAPLLSKCGAPATFFVTTRWLESPGEYWWDTFERALRAGAANAGILDIEVDGQPTRFLSSAPRIARPRMRGCTRRWSMPHSRSAIA